MAARRSPPSTTTVIAANESIRFDIRQSFLCGDEAANVGVIRITFAGGVGRRGGRDLHLPAVAGRQDRLAAGILGAGRSPDGVLVRADRPAVDRVTA